MLDFTRAQYHYHDFHFATALRPSPLMELWENGKKVPVSKPYVLTIDGESQVVE